MYVQIKSTDPPPASPVLPRRALECFHNKKNISSFHIKPDHREYYYHTMICVPDNQPFCVQYNKVNIHNYIIDIIGLHAYTGPVVT